MKKGEKSTSDIPLEIRAEKALKEAVAEAIANHKRDGDPIVVWQDGKVVKIAVDRIEIGERAAEYKKTCKKDK